MYYYTSFNGTSLSLCNPVDQSDTAPARTRFTQTASGSFDADSSARSGYTFPYDLTYRFLVRNGTPATLKSTIDTIRCLVGQEGKLYRTADDGSGTTWATARARRVIYDREIIHDGFQEMAIVFAIKSFWRKERIGWKFDSGETFDNSRTFDEGQNTFTLSSSSGVISVNHEGTADVTDAVITLTAGTDAVTGFSMFGNDWSLDFTSDTGFQVEPGESLVIDSSAYRVTINGANAYEHLGYTPLHTMRGWTKFEPGSRIYTYGLVGGSTDSILRITFDNQWI